MQIASIFFIYPVDSQIWISSEDKCYFYTTLQTKQLSFHKPYIMNSSKIDGGNQCVIMMKLLIWSDLHSLLRLCPAVNIKVPTKRVSYRHYIDKNAFQYHMGDLPDRDPPGQRPVQTETPLWNKMTHRCKNITFPQLRLWAVKMQARCNSWLTFVQRKNTDSLLVTDNKAPAQQRFTYFEN